MKLSARNTFKGTIVEVQEGVVTGEVKVDIGDGKIISATVTMDAVKDLDMKVGDDAWVLFKASAVIVAKE
jgi:molybdopterin-binding protein